MKRSGEAELLVVAEQLGSWVAQYVIYTVSAKTSKHKQTDSQTLAMS